MTHFSALLPLGSFLRQSYKFLSFRNFLNVKGRAPVAKMAPPIKQWTSNLKGIDGLQQAVAPMPAPGQGEVLVEVHAVSLNFRDTEGE
jgi:hypothetical protein